jgi:hypothetical protein
MVSTIVDDTDMLVDSDVSMFIIERLQDSWNAPEIEHVVHLFQNEQLAFYLLQNGRAKHMDADQVDACFRGASYALIMERRQEIHLCDINKLISKIDPEEVLTDEIWPELLEPGVDGENVLEYALHMVAVYGGGQDCQYYSIGDRVLIPEADLM